MDLAERIDSLLEMAAPKSSHKGLMYYHGTAKTSSAKGILRSGIKPPDLSVAHRSDRLDGKGGPLRPRDGKVYLTNQLRYAIVYAIGADMLGQQLPDQFIGKEPYGYVFLVPGKELKDIEPDEDSIGELLSAQLRGDTNDFGWLKDIAHKILRRRDFMDEYPDELVGYDSILDAVEDGDYVSWAIIGRAIVDNLEDWMVYDILKSGGIHVASGIHVANKGKVVPSECWQLDKRKTQELRKDGSNFYDIAKRIKSL